jgi:hypothetical protein
VYINQDLEEEIYEYYWIQFPKKQYLKLKLFKGKLQSIRVKKEEKESDVEKQIRDFLDKKLTQFYTDMDGNKFAEVHMDVLDYIVIVPKMTKTFHCWASLAKTKVSD